MNAITNFFSELSIVQLTMIGVAAAVLLAMLYKRYMRIPSCPYHPQGVDHNCPMCNAGKEYLSVGAIAGIVIGVIVLLIIIGVVVFFVLKRKNRGFREDGRTIWSE